MSGDAPSQGTYALRAKDLADIAVPDLPWRPPMPRGGRHRIALIGAGGIAAAHLAAYRDAGWDVAAICGRTLPRARERAAAFFPGARVTDDLGSVLADPAIDVLDVTPHPADRVPIVETALAAGKHVLSQKPFVLDLDTGARLVALARGRGVKLAVNQNGRWAPHMAFMREAVRAGLIGDVIGLHASVHWDHGWIAGTPFEAVEDLILLDFGIHWFDFVMSVAGPRVRAVTATAAFARGQAAKVPLLAQAIVRLDGGQASLVFDGAVPAGSRDTTFIAGTRGSLQSDGPGPRVAVGEPDHGAGPGASGAGGRVVQRRLPGRDGGTPLRHRRGPRTRQRGRRRTCRAWRSPSPRSPRGATEAR